MVGKITVQNENTTVEFEWEELSPQPEQTIRDAAHLMWSRGMGNHGTGVIFDDLVQEDWLDIWDEYLKRVTLDAARECVLVEAMKNAREEAEVISVQEHGLGD
jgi:hypothetical protein